MFSIIISLSKSNWEKKWSEFAILYNIKKRSYEVTKSKQYCRMHLTVSSCQAKSDNLVLWNSSNFKQPIILSEPIFFFTFLRILVLAKNSNFLIPIYLQPDIFNLWYFKLSFDLTPFTILRSPPLGCKHGIRKSNFSKQYFSIL